MGKIELEALRRRARAAGIDPGIVARAARAKIADQGTREWDPERKRYLPSRQMGLRPPREPRLRPSLPVDVSAASRWVVAVCKPALAFGVADDLNDLGFLAYCPVASKVLMRARVRGSNKRTRRVHQSPVFGPYLFVGEIDEPLQASIHDGLLAVIGDAQGAWPLNPRLVQMINDAELSGKWDEARVPDWRTHKFKKGDRVLVKRGPFADLAGLVVELSKAGVVVEFELFGRKTHATVQATVLEEA